MYRYISNTLDFSVDVVFLYDTDKIAASANINDFYIPSGPVISEMKKTNPQMVADYDAFVESIEDLLIDYYGLELAYYNDSDDNSRYYNFIAKDETGKISVKFRLRLRVSNHDPKRSKNSQKYKKEELKSPELEKYLDIHSIKNIRPYTKIIIINSKEYRSYEEAFRDIDKKIESYIQIMTK